MYEKLFFLPPAPFSSFLISFFSKRLLFSMSSHLFFTLVVVPVGGCRHQKTDSTLEKENRENWFLARKARRQKWAEPRRKLFEILEDYSTHS
ncbi:hypothetical protein B9Z55_010261 [Caenorhabditis nigoni]|uniref:Uncharacterized protein n=1 Tax=Caenorhabditis nigoni TaxID=1611254 RepID=A0A2G5UF31_9PELO|nr:hypothetical protein B9Z55_010261 [Caenorhabditis nigoni]